MLRHSRLAKKSRRCGLNNEFAPFAPFMAPLAEIAREFFEKLPKSGLMGDTNSKGFSRCAKNPESVKQNGVEPRSNNKGTNNEA